MRASASILTAALAIAVLVSAGCGKKASLSQAPREEAGVKVDMPKLMAAFSAGDASAMRTASDIDANFRYGLYEKVLQDLQKLATNPNLTEQQKRVVNQVIDQVKQVINKAGPAR